MDKAVHQAQETIEKAGHVASENFHATHRRPEEVNAERSANVMKETGHVGAHRVEETLDRAADWVGQKLNPQPTTGQKVDSALNSVKNTFT